MTVKEDHLNNDSHISRAEGTECWMVSNSRGENLVPMCNLVHTPNDGFLRSSTYGKTDLCSRDDDHNDDDDDGAVQT